MTPTSLQTMDKGALIRVIEKNQNRLKTLHVTVLGKMRRGKTNISAYLAEYYSRKNWEIRYARGIGPEKAQEIINTPVKNGVAGVLIILDDLTFLYSMKVEETFNFENALSQIRHNVGTDDVIIVFNYHYLKGIPPFMRDADIKILVSLTKPARKWLEQEGMFTKKWLNRYFKVYRKWLYGEIKNGRPVLISDDVSETITVIPKVNQDILFKNQVYEERSSSSVQDGYTEILWSFFKKVMKNAHIQSRGERYSIIIPEKTSVWFSKTKIEPLIKNMGRRKRG